MFNIFTSKKLDSFVDITPETRDDFYREFGMVMRMIRHRKNISIADIAKKLHLPESEIESYECGKPVPFIEGVAIYQYLGMVKNPVRYKD